MPKFSTISMVSTFADTPELRYFNSPQAIGTLGLEISDDPKKIFSRYSKPYEFVPPDENYSYYFTTMYGAEENGVELRTVIREWRPTLWKSTLKRWTITMTLVMNVLFL